MQRIYGSIIKIGDYKMKTISLESILITSKAKYEVIYKRQTFEI